jgi:hypothetical protein
VPNDIGVSLSEKGASSCWKIEQSATITCKIHVQNPTLNATIHAQNPKLNAIMHAQNPTLTHNNPCSKPNVQNPTTLTSNNP